jgi:hypothetical protein
MVEFEVKSRGRGYFEVVASIALIPLSSVRVEAKVIFEMYFLHVIKLTILACTQANIITSLIYLLSNKRRRLYSLHWSYTCTCCMSRGFIEVDASADRVPDSDARAMAICTLF